MEHENKREQYKALMKIAVPISLQSLITAGLGLVGNLMVSRLGDTELSAVGLAGQFLGLYHLCVLGVGMGATVLTGRFWGKEDKEHLKQTVTLMLRTVLLLAAIFSFASAAVPYGILGLYSKQSGVIGSGAVYLRMQVPSYLCMGLSVGCTAVLRSVGQVRVPLYASVGALVVQTALGWGFIFGNMGLPSMGVAGASLALVLARGFECAVIVGCFFFTDQRIGYRPKDLAGPCGELLRPYLRVTVPVAVSNGLLGLGENVSAAVMGRMGQTFVAANSVASVMQLLSGVLTQGVAHAAGIFTGHTIGRGDLDEAKAQARLFVRVGTWMGVGAAVLIFLLRDGVIGLYGVTEETAATARLLMGAIGVIVLFQSPGTVLSKGVLRAGGDTVFLMVTDAVLQWGIALPLGALAGLVLGLPMVWVYLLLRSDQVLRCAICLLRLRTGKWLKNLGGNA